METPQELNSTLRLLIMSRLSSIHHQNLTLFIVRSDFVTPQNYKQLNLEAILYKDHHS